MTKSTLFKGSLGDHNPMPHSKKKSTSSIFLQKRAPQFQTVTLLSIRYISVSDFDIHIAEKHLISSCYS